MDDVAVLCLLGRMIGDHIYVAGERYTLTAAQAQKYAATGYFRILSDPTPAEPPGADAKMSPTPENKLLRGRQTKERS